MTRIKWPAISPTRIREAVHFLTLLDHIMMIRAQRLQIGRIPEQFRIASMRHHMVDNQKAAPLAWLPFTSCCQRSVIDDASLSAVAAERFDREMGEPKPVPPFPASQLVEGMIGHF